MRERAFPFPEPVMKVTRVVSFIVRFEGPFYDGNTGGNAEENQTFRPRTENACGQRSDLERKVFLYLRKDLPRMPRKNTAL